MNVHHLVDRLSCQAPGPHHHNFTAPTPRRTIHLRVLLE